MRRDEGARAQLAGRCLAVFVEAGSLDVSLDQMAGGVGISKRMLVRYFGTREGMEHAAMELLEEQLRTMLAPEQFPEGVSGREVVAALWERTTASASRNVLMLIMDVSRRAWSGSERARAFYAEQRELWMGLLMGYFRDGAKVEAVLQMFQGSALEYLVTGDAERGRRALDRAAGGMA